MIRTPVWNFALWRSSVPGALLGQPVKRAWLPLGRADGAAWLGWGYKHSTKRAGWYARLRGGRVIRLEDGFLRSYGTGEHYPPLSLVVDDTGIYYDGTRPSALESLLNSPTDVLAGLAQDVARAKALLLSHRLSKYNHSPALAPGALHQRDGRRVLVVDQTAGDLSVTLGSANADTFAAMLAAARAENPDATIYVKTHPEVSSGRKRGYLTWVRDDQRTVVLRQAINPLDLLERMDRVYVVTSQMGFEALLAGKPVTAFGMPWYAGWGVTDDRQACERRTRARSVDELFAAAYFHYARYLNPATRGRGTIFDVIEWLVLQKSAAEQCTGRRIAVGFSALRRWVQAPLLGPDTGRVAYVADAERAAALRPGALDCLLVWGRSASAELTALARGTGTRLLHMEDGFVRSVGLGSDLVPPRSFVFDELGLYFDPGGPSDLEMLLNTASFSELELARARGVRAFIVANGITKYNVEPLDPPNWASQGRRVLLVPGQVEDDASIRLGCDTVRTNLALLEAARTACPDAFIVYKPHPDVMAGNRRGGAAMAQASRFADHVETGVSLVSCIDACDEVHTMTSLSGFDALLRGKRVVAFGRPFYAGWGLTVDRLAMPRRQRRLSLDELVAGALLRYPVYWDPLLKGHTTCEAVLHGIVAERERLRAMGRTATLGASWWWRQRIRIWNLARSLWEG